ncbi:MAG: glycosyl hydrolase [Saprospiraceae bacterium]|nr:glycosyl hydrolase [Saprospiraceae bacterium]
MNSRFLFFLPLLLFGLKSDAQTKINSSTFGSIEPRAMGPGTMSGRITAIEGVESDGKTLYIGTAGGGIWKSTNAGASFSPIFDKHCQSIGALAIDQKNPKTIYAGAGESNMRNSVSIGDGMYKSSDEGSNWIKIGLDSTEHISKILLDPSNANILYVAAPGPLWSDSPHRGLYKSTDAGKTWEKILYINPRTGVADIAIDPRNPNIVFATSWEFRRTPYSFESGGKGSALYKSTDAGKTWNKISKGLPTGDFGRIALTLAPSAPDKMLAIVEAKKTGLYISEDAGENWKEQSATFNVVSRPFYFSTLVIDPKDPKRVYRPALSFSYSDDGGYSFTDASNAGGWVHSDHHALWINPNNTNFLVLGTDGGVYISNDRGATFMFCHNLPVGQFYHVAVDTKSPYNIYGGLQDNGSWVGPSARPGGVSNGDWKLLYFGDGFWTVPDPSDPDIVYAEYQGGNMARIDLQTFKNFPIQPFQTNQEDKLRWNWNTPIIVGQKNKKNLYVGAQYLFKSKDQGRNWERISPDLTTNNKKKQNQEDSGGLSVDNTSAENHCTIFTAAESPLDENTIWVGTDDGNVQITRDGGKTWNNTSAAYSQAGIPAQTWISSIEPSKFDVNTAYITLDNHAYGDHQTYLIKTTDGGKSYSRIQSPEFTGFAHKVVEDRINKNLLFLGTETGLFASIDGAASWFRMKSGFPEYSLVRDIQIHPTENALIIGTHGRGIYVYDDISALRNMTPELANQSVYFFPVSERIISDGKYGGGGPYSGGWNAPNPESILPFQYYLKDRMLSGEAKLDIFDEDGKLVQTIPAGKRKGINKVYWNFRMKPPKVAESSTKLDFGAFFAPEVLPGQYKLVLTAGTQVLEQKITLKHVDEKNYTLEDRKLQHEISMKYYRMHEDLARTVEELNQELKTYVDAASKVKNKKNKEQINQYIGQLEKLRGTLVASKHASVFADETKLREEITEAYSKVAQGHQRPSNLMIEREMFLRNKVDTSAKDLKNLKTTQGVKCASILKSEKIPMDFKS